MTTAYEMPDCSAAAGPRTRPTASDGPTDVPTDPSGFLAVLPRPGRFACRGACGTILERPGVCDDCGRAIDRREHDALLRPALESIPERYRWATPDAPELVARVAVAARPEPMADRVRALMASRVVVLVGASGAGKTSLACALLRAHIDAGRLGAPDHAVSFARRARFFAARLLAPEPGRRSDEMPVAALVSRASVALIDDVGQEAGSGESFRASDRTRALADALMDRHDSGAKTIVTTYLEEAAFAKLYGDGCARRYFSRDDAGVRVVKLRGAK